MRSNVPGQLPPPSPPTTTSASTRSLLFVDVQPAPAGLPRLQQPSTIRSCTSVRAEGVGGTPAPGAAATCRDHHRGDEAKRPPPSPTWPARSPASMAQSAATTGTSRSSYSAPWSSGAAAESVRRTMMAAGRRRLPRLRPGHLGRIKVGNLLVALYVRCSPHRRVVVVGERYAPLYWRSPATGVRARSPGEPPGTAHLVTRLDGRPVEPAMGADIALAPGGRRRSGSSEALVTEGLCPRTPGRIP